MSLKRRTLNLSTIPLRRSTSFSALALYFNSFYFVYTGTLVPRHFCQIFLTFFVQLSFDDWFKSLNLNVC